MDQRRQCVVLAGGLGTRMLPFTGDCAKSMLPVAGKPFVHHQLDRLAAEGISDVVYCIGYRGGSIRDYIGDGSRWGVRARYVDEGEQLRGTAGAIRLALDQGAPGSELRGALRRFLCSLAHTGLLETFRVQWGARHDGGDSQRQPVGRKQHDSGGRPDCSVRQDAQRSTIRGHAACSTTGCPS